MSRHGGEAGAATESSVSELAQVVIAAIARATDRPREEIHDDDELMALGLDSLDFSTILVEVEDEIGQEVPVEVLDELSLSASVVTVGDVLALLEGWDPVEPTVTTTAMSAEVRAGSDRA